MNKRRVFVPAEAISEGAVRFPPKTERYLRKALRLETGDEVEVFDGRVSRTVRLIVGRDGVLGEVVDSAAETDVAAPPIILAFGCVRPGPLAEILRHGTEVGVTEFAALITGRTERRPEEKKSRWESIVASAAGQSGRVDVPEVRSPKLFDDFLEAPAEAEDRIILSVSPEAESVVDWLESGGPRGVIVLVGPEGGFEEDEERRAIDRGFRPVSLGPTVLRTETACIVAAGLITALRASRGVSARS